MIIYCRRLLLWWVGKILPQAHVGRQMFLPELYWTFRSEWDQTF